MDERRADFRDATVPNIISSGEIDEGEGGSAMLRANIAIAVGGAENMYSRVAPVDTTCGEAGGHGD